MSVQQSPEPSGQSPRRPGRALRLRFEYEGDQVRLVDIQRLEKVTPPSDPLDPDTKARESGFWFEVQGARRRPLYRLVRENPLVTSVELHTGNVREPIVRHDLTSPRGSFFLLVPDLPDAQDVVLYSSPIATDDPKAAAEPATELARFDLRRAPGQGRQPRGKEQGS